MKTFVICSLLGVLATACANVPKKNAVIYDKINHLIIIHATKKDVTEILGQPDKSEKESFEYYQNGTRSLKAKVYFDSESKVNEALLLLGKNQIEGFKKFIGCIWVEKRGKVELGHGIFSTYEGKCDNGHIHFKYHPDEQFYEVRWNS